MTHSSEVLLDGDQTAYYRGDAEFMRSLASDLFDMTPMKSERNRGYFSVRSWYSGNIVLLQSHYDASLVRRDKSRAENSSNALLIQRYVSGGVRSEKDGFNMDRKPGEVYLLDHGRPVETIQSPIVSDCIYLPKDVIGYDPDRHPPFVRFSENEVWGPIIFAEFDHIFRGLLGNNTLDTLALDRLLACFREAIGSAGEACDERRLARDAIARQIHRFIDSNLEDPSLSVTSILGKFGVSRASLYRMFDDHGGVRQFISDRRLNRAVIELAERPLVRGRVSAVAEKWGFSSDANFNRSVRRQFGVAPGSLFQFSLPAPQLLTPDPKLREVLVPS